MALFLAGAVAMRAAGCVVNDLRDRRLDRQVERTAGRPLAAGTIGIFEALLFLGLLCAIGLTVLVQLPFLAIPGIAALPLIVLYPLAKRVTMVAAGGPRADIFMGRTSWMGRCQRVATACGACSCLCRERGLGVRLRHHLRHSGHGR